MSPRIVQRTTLPVLLACGLAAAARAQIPLPPPPPLPGLEVRITTSHPPALRHEHRSPRPSDEYIWIHGFWHRDGDRWQWVSGRWELPPEPGVYWVEPRYVHVEGSYIYEPGHWSNQRVIVSDRVREHRAWRHHEREHDRDHDREHP